MTDTDILQLRNRLHRNAEISNREFKTSEIISEFLRQLSPDEVISLGNTGKAFVFNSGEEGNTLVFRAELDALPIHEVTDKDYKSEDTATAHSCGHDGHMTILAGLAKRIAQDRPGKGKTILLFQPAEEVEQGAKDVVENPAFSGLSPDYIFALHNIPGIDANKILLSQGCFAAASRGMTIKLHGRTSHAAEPENGINPARAISIIINGLQELQQDKDAYADMVLLTIIHILLGKRSFGTSPGYAEICVTLRSFRDEDMDLLVRRSEEMIRKVARDERLKHEIMYNEIFPATINHAECVRIAETAAAANGFQYEYLKSPFRWSEDFAYYTQEYKACLFGLGAGLSQPNLHNPDYDFPDGIIDTGINMFFTIYKNLNF